MTEETNLRRVLIERGFGHGAHQQNEFCVLEGSGNMNTVIYTGSLQNCKLIKIAYLATGEYEDTSTPEYQ